MITGAEIKRPTTWIAAVLMIVLGALLGKWWDDDRINKELYTHDWHKQVNEHVTSGNHSMIEFEAIKQAIPEMRDDIKSLKSDMIKIREYIAKEDGRHSR